MIDPQTQLILQGILRRESRSLLCYAGDAYPWATAAESATAAALLRAVQEERAAIAALGRFLARRSFPPPPLGAYPSGFTSFNFIALDFLLARLREEQERLHAELKADLARINDPDARVMVENLLAVKDRTLALLSSKTPARSGAPDVAVSIMPLRDADFELIDTHAHLDAEQFAGDLDAVLHRARAAGVGQIVAVGITASSSAHCVRIASAEAGVFATVGIHPNEAADAGAGDWDEVLRLVEGPRVVGVGETGLDRHWDRTPFALQEEYFARHLELGRTRNLAVVIHCRDCEADVVRMLREAYDRHGQIQGVLHSFTGTQATAEACLAMGLYVSFAGMLTYKNASELRATAAKAPLDRVLVETDSPYLSPVPLRGKRNEPAHVVHTAACLAELHGISAEELAERTTRNARALFGLG